MHLVKNQEEHMYTKNKKDFLSITDISTEEILAIFQTAKKLKNQLKKSGKNKQVLQGKSLALVFEKQSLRTRISFEIGMAQLGGHTVYLDPRDTGIGVRESEEDVARVLSSMADIIAVRTYSHQTIVRLATSSTVPVINALSDIEHPCQALTDLFTLWEIKGKLNGLTIACVGDGDNNVVHSLCIGATMFGMKFRCASPKGYAMNKDIIGKIRQSQKNSVMQTIEPEKAVANADIVVTDTWVSMGDENKEERLKLFTPYQVNTKLMQYAKKGAIFMHCLPAYRGKEVTAEVIDGKQSVVFQEAENRLHVQKALLLFLLEKHS